MSIKALCLIFGSESSRKVCDESSGQADFSSRLTADHVINQVAQFVWGKSYNCNDFIKSRLERE